jgi:protocatechuate 3,4-dioxygenase beta subunit
VSALEFYQNVSIAPFIVLSPAYVIIAHHDKMEDIYMIFNRSLRVKKSLLLSASLAVGLLLTACGAPAISTTSPAPAASAVQESTAAPAATEVITPTARPAVTLAPPEIDTPEATAASPANLDLATGEPNCTVPASLTPAATEGPYFTAGSPERSSLLEPGMSGTKLVLSGYVLTTDCQPVANALLDFWQADANGNYDNSGYTLRGHQFTDANGFYQLETVVPGLYPGRTEHIHVKVQSPGGAVLTTQLFFPGVANNQSDGIYNPALMITIQNDGDPLKGTFNFIVGQ